MMMDELLDLDNPNLTHFTTQRRSFPFLSCTMVPAIISKETWVLAQQKRQQRKKFVKGNEKHPYLCNGVLFCSICGNRLSGRTTKGRKPGHKNHSYYICYGRSSRWQGECSLPYFSVDEVDRVVWSEIERLVKNPNLLEQVLTLQEEDTTAYTEDDVKKLEKALAEKRDEQDSMLRLYRKGVVSEAQLESQLAEIKDEEQALLEEKECIRSRLSEADASTENLGFFQHQVEVLQANIDQFSFEQKRELVRTIAVGDETNKIEVNPEGELVIKGVIDFSGYCGDVMQLDKYGAPARSFSACCGIIGCKRDSGAQPSLGRCDAQPGGH